MARERLRSAPRMGLIGGFFALAWAVLVAAAIVIFGLDLRRRARGGPRDADGAAPTGGVSARRRRGRRR